MRGLCHGTDIFAIALGPTFPLGLKPRQSNCPKNSLLQLPDALPAFAMKEPDRSQDRAHCLQIPGFVGFQR